MQEARGALEILLERVESLGEVPGIPTVDEVAIQLTLVYDALRTDAPRAVELAQLACEDTERRHGGESDATMMRARLARALTRAGDLDSADSVCAAAMEEATSDVPQEPHLIWFTHTTLADLRIAQHRFEDAEAVLLEADAIMRSSPSGEVTDELGWIGEALIRLYEAWHAADPDGGHDAEAAEWGAKSGD